MVATRWKWFWLAVQSAVSAADCRFQPTMQVMQQTPGLDRCRRLLALAVGAGPSGAALDFRHASRGSSSTIDELGRLVLNACQVGHPFVC